ncbi:outer membrane lipoprotein carrier protein LolA [Flavobacterium silvaticum]|uniref:Outer membrane lipoprotein carrier protein LolA n=1 Tax=Flavobacterium silvaticum TaxID=1852020 RepID=A0A972JIZ7_9FLAO|nr:outer membrane lipoprotein carrier protein LolA [Flavobacterium silvaticum]NMH27702.1 outer membrane lipoprotein carrier protein LolA [Flavobacterium silvaticum]
MDATEIKAFREAVNAKSAAIKSMTTDFTQYKHMDFLSKDVETSGKMAFKEPNTLLWEYKKPYNYSIVFKNGKISINDEGKKSQMDASGSKIFAKINKLIVGSVSGNLFDDKEFTISYFTNANFNFARLIPKDAALKKYIKEIELSFSKKEATVEQVRLLESDADYTKIVFKNKVLNAKVDDAAFRN